MSAVVQVITALERGGAQRIALELADGLHRSDRPIYLLAGRGAALDEEARDRLRERLILLRHLKNPLSFAGDLAGLVELHRVLSRLHNDLGTPLLVHTHSSKAGVLGRLAARAVPGTVVMHTVHGFGSDALGQRARPILDAAERIAGAATDAMVFVARKDEQRAAHEGIAPRARRFVVPGFSAVPPAYADAESRSRARARFGIPDDVPVAVTVANLKEQKDPLFHAHVLAAWRAQQPDARLLLLGDGPLRSALDDATSALGLRGALLAPGFLDDPSAALAAADVYLLASRWEGLPMSVLEALASGLPVVARDTGWTEDIGMPDRLLALPPSAAPTAFAAALDRAIAVGRAPVELPSRFTRDGMLAATDRIYDELASASSAST